MLYVSCQSWSLPLSFSTDFSQACEELLTGIDYTFVANSFTIFRQLTPRFPFVELKPAADVATMVASQPFLTLAICTVACAAHPEAQQRLSQAFRYALSSKVIIGSERSLDLFLGLLVFLAWHHQYMADHHIYHHISLLASLAADQGLYSPRLVPSIERDRAFVGCYYLCSTLSAVGFDKPNPLRWTSNLRYCAERVASSGLLQSDQAIPALLELAYAIDDMEDGLRQISSSNSRQMISFIDLYTESANQRLRAIQRDHQSVAANISSTAASIHIYQHSVRSNPNPDSSTLIQCACAIKDFIDDLIARPPSFLHQLSIVDWTFLLEILLLMVRIAKPSQATTTSTVGGGVGGNGGSWGAGALQEMLQPAAYLDALYNHMAKASANDPLEPRSEALLVWLGRIRDGLKQMMSSEGARRQEERGKSREEEIEALELEEAWNSFGSAIWEVGFLRRLM